jgi:hypothetical protein
MATVRHLGLFPWCFNPDTTYFKTADAIRKFAVPMWWQVKEWTLESTAQVQANTEPPKIDTYAATQVFRITDLPISSATTSTFAKETDLILAGKAGFSTNGVGPEYNWRFGPIIEFVNICELVIGPDFLFEAYTDDTVGVATNATGPTLGAIECAFSGISFSAPLKQMPYPEGGPLYEIVSLQSTLTATEYWPYA